MFRSHSFRSSQRLPHNGQPMSCFSTTSIFYIFFFSHFFFDTKGRTNFFVVFHDGAAGTEESGQYPWRVEERVQGGEERQFMSLARVAHVTQRSFSSKEWVVFAGQIGAPWFDLFVFFLGLLVIFSFSITFLHNPTVGIIRFAKASDTEVIQGAHDFMVWMSNMDQVSPRVTIVFCKTCTIAESPSKRFFMLLLSISFAGTTMTISTFFEFGLEEKLSNKLYLYYLCTGKDLISTFYHPLYFEF